MKKFYAVLGSAAVCASAVAAPASLEGRIDLKNFVKVEGMADAAKPAEAKQAKFTQALSQPIIPLKAQSPMKKASTEVKTVVLYEDFSNVPDGNTETIGKLGDRYTDYIASDYFEPGLYVNNDYTPESGTWAGDFLMAGKGGTVVLQCYNPQMGAFLYTPLGDYSGDITVTVRCRAATTFYGADNEYGYVSATGSDLQCAAKVGRYDSYDYATTDIDGWGALSTGQMYEKEGWKEVTFKFRNESPNADGYLMFATSGAVEIDWIKVTDDNTFLACPNVRGASNFTNDGFTISWDPMRRSYNYYIDLWKVKYIADKGLDEGFDFESETFPAWLSGKQVDYAEGEGFGDTNAVAIAADGTDNGLELADMGMKLGSFTTKVKFDADEELTGHEEPIYLMYDVLTDNGWQPLGYIGCDGFWSAPGYWYSVKLDGSVFEDQYKAVRVYADGLLEEERILIDDMSVWAKRPFVLERVKGPGNIYDEDDDDYAYNYYYNTGGGRPTDKWYADYDATCYTFYDLDPTQEYWYRVRSHNVHEFSVGEKHHALGVPAPVLGEAENVGAGSYTATWTDAPKADKYYVNNYSAEVIKAADKEYPLLVEEFSNCDGESEIDLMDPIEGSFDNYTDLKGWTSNSGMYGYRMIGCDYRGYLLSPMIFANPERGSVYVYLDVIGMSGDYLTINCIKSGFGGEVAFDDDGGVNGYIEIPAVEGEQIRISSAYGMNLALCGFEVVQAVEAGDIVRRFESQQEVGNGVQACTFSNLDGEIYAYSVQSSFTLERETALSSASDFKTVNVKNPGSGVTNELNAIDGAVTVTDRFAVDGTRVASDYKGIVLLKKSNGSVSKSISK